MNHVLKLTNLTILLTMALVTAFSQKPIYLGIDSANDTVLTLSDNGLTTLGRVFNRDVFWQINDARIQKFEIVPKFPIDGDPFTERPNRPHTNRLPLRVRSNGRLGYWYYSIDWVDTHGNSHHSDPKIAVNPIRPLVDTILLIGFAITAVTSILFYRKWSRAKLVSTQNENNI